MLFSVFQCNKELFVGDKGFIMDVKSRHEKFRIMSYILTGDMKSTFVYYQRLVEDNKNLTSRMFEWINMSFSNPKDRPNVIQLLTDEYMYLVIFSKFFLNFFNDFF